MFTGIIKYEGKLRGVDRIGSGGRLTLECPEMSGVLKPGDSLAVDGVCLTLSGTGPGLSFDLSAETLARTTLGALPPGWGLNLEPPLAAGEALGGHIVTGHVDAIARVLAREGEGLKIGTPPALRDYIYPKGSVALNGVSLTVAACGPGYFALALIPETLARTNLKRLALGAAVNLEADTLVKAKLHAERGQGLTLEKLRKAGFI